MRTLFTLALSLFLFACSGEQPPAQAQKQTPQVITSNTGGNQYHNAFFGVRVEKPEGWYSQPPEETIALQQRGTAALANEEEGMKAMIEASLQQSTPIFGFFEVPPGTPERLNPNVMSVAENLKGFPGIASGCDYLAQVRSLLEQGRMQYQFSPDCETRQLGGRELSMIEGRLEMAGVNITQRYYALLRDEYAIAFIPSSSLASAAVPRCCRSEPSWRSSAVRGREWRPGASGARIWPNVTLRCKTVA